MKDISKYRLQILKWTCIGLTIRFILMPFTMHTLDLFFMHYFPMMFVKRGIWDPFGLIAANFSYFPSSYYGPSLFITMSIFDFIIIKLFNPVSLIKMLEVSGTMMFRSFTQVDYASILSGFELFKNLFLLKIPYLLFDFLAGAILLKLTSSKEIALKSYKLWMLNIVVLHSIYMIGQCDLIVAFFVILALFLAMKQRPYMCIASLVMGGGVKLFPYILILPACLLLGQNWRKRFWLLFTGGLITLSLYLPFYLSSGNAIFRAFKACRAYTGMAEWVLMGICAILYLLISLRALKDSQQPQPEKKLLFYFLTITFLVYAATPISFRYFVFITPLLALFLPQHKRFALFTLFIILMLMFLRLPTRSVQLGLFAPLNPEYFVSFPSIHEIIGQFINIEIAYKIMARVLLISFFAAAYWVWRIKLIEHTESA